MVFPDYQMIWLFKIQLDISTFPSIDRDRLERVWEVWLRGA